LPDLDSRTLSRRESGVRGKRGNNPAAGFPTGAVEKNIEQRLAIFSRRIERSLVAVLGSFFGRSLLGSSSGNSMAKYLALGTILDPLGLHFTFLVDRLLVTTTGKFNSNESNPTDRFFTLDPSQFLGDGFLCNAVLDNGFDPDGNR
jgi:hypothetical protein